MSLEAGLDPFPEAALTGGDDGGGGAYLNADQRGPTQPNGKDSFTIAEAADRIVRGEPGWSAALGVSFTVTYAYRADAPANMPSDTAGFSRFNTAQINQAELALTAWSDVARITFVRVGSGTSGDNAYSNQASILMANYSSGEAGAAAFGNYPGNTSFSSSSGDLWVNSSIGYNENPTANNRGGMVLIHELGHTIGLAHPGEYNAEADTVVAYGPDADYYEDSRQYTVMSYFSETNTGANYNGFFPAAPMLDDIAAAQLEYGANMSTRTGDTTYGFNSNAGRPWYELAGGNARAIFAIWDAGGNDTLDLSGYAQNQTIELRAGFFSNAGGLTGNVAIAAGVTIENARGGSGADTITGNSSGNYLWGGAGGDQVFGREGFDVIRGEDGQDYLRGDDGDDWIEGGAAFDDLNGNVGNDTEWGGLGADWVVGGKDNDLLYGEEEADIVYGNLGNDTGDGGTGDDLIRGGQGDDSLVGGAGADYISGDRENDTMSGGAGADTFHSFCEAGIDRVLDFNRAEGDLVRLDPGTTWTVAQAGADTIVSMTGGGQVILVGVSMASLTGDWIFAG